jgi:hypothetical protein
VGAVLIHVDGQTGMMKILGAFCYYTNAPKKEVLISVNSKIQFKYKSRILVYSL